MLMLKFEVGVNLSVLIVFDDSGNMFFVWVQCGIVSVILVVSGEVCQLGELQQVSFMVDKFFDIQLLFGLVLFECFEDNQMVNIDVIDWLEFFWCEVFGVWWYVFQVFRSCFFGDNIIDIDQ